MSPSGNKIHQAKLRLPDLNALNCTAQIYLRGENKYEDDILS